MSSQTNQIKALTIAVDELTSDLNEVRGEVNWSGASLQEERRSRRVALYLLERKLQELDERLAKLESRANG